MGTIFKTNISKHFELKDHVEANEFYSKNSGSGKVLFKIGGE